jgi:hypothetical protein
MPQTPLPKLRKEVQGSVERIRRCPVISFHKTYTVKEILDLIPTLGINGVAM